ncbi:hypothetical protein [Chryseolinea serpens]|nr:hypothetical protein [Chryseolinea serpens]
MPGTGVRTEQKVSAGGWFIKFGGSASVGGDQSSRSMIRIKHILFFGVILFSSCEGLRSKEGKVQALQNQNQLSVANGDTLETGFWTYYGGVDGVSKSGSYTDGYKMGKWVYKMQADSISTTWRVVNEQGVKFNIPEHLKQINKVEPPVLFQADVDDNDENTYLILLRYNLKELKSSVYDYIYQYNESWKSNTEETLRSKEFKKFCFEGIEVFRAKVATERKSKYEATSYIFVVKDYLYDLTYKNAIGKSTAIDLEIFNDVLYSMECENVDLFDYNRKKYLKEENVEFKSNPIN